MYSIARTKVICNIQAMELSGITCPECKASVVEDEWTSTHADHNGSPVEESGKGIYCTNSKCFHNIEPLDL